MARYLIIYDPNAAIKGPHSEFRVHLNTCQAGQREAKLATQKHGNSWPVDSDTVETLIKEEVEQYQEQDQGYSEDDFYVCNCAK